MPDSSARSPACPAQGTGAGGGSGGSRRDPTLISAITPRGTRAMWKMSRSEESSGPLRSSQSTQNAALHAAVADGRDRCAHVLHLRLPDWLAIMLICAREFSAIALPMTGVHA